jgi:hypothetical protein
MTTENTEKILESLGFFNEIDGYMFPYGEYHNEKDSAKICLKPDGIYGYTIGSNEFDDYLEMHLNFIPEDEEMLRYLIKRVFYID